MASLLKLCGRRCRTGPQLGPRWTGLPPRLRSSRTPSSSFLPTKRLICQGCAATCKVHGDLLKAVARTEAAGELLDNVRLIRDFWRGNADLGLTEGWRGSMLVLLYKQKGDRSCLDNWRGICLLDICPKLACSLINKRLQSLAEQVVPDSFTGFRRHRGVSDSAFALRRLVESFLHTKGSQQPGEEDALYICFLDLRKAFDAVPRQSLWRLLGEHYGVPPHVLGMLQQVRTDFAGQVCYKNRLSAAFPLGTGVRQGSCEGPTLWLLYFHALMHVWHDRCATVGLTLGIPWQFKADGHVRSARRLQNAATSACEIGEFVYADDTAFVDTNWEAFQTKTSLLTAAVTDFGGTASTTKTEWMRLDGFQPPAERLAEDLAPLPGHQVLRMAGDGLPRASCFNYLGSLIASDVRGGISQDVARRVRLAHAAAGYLRHVWKSPRLTRATKRKVLLTAVLPVLLWGSESWSTTANDRRRLRCCWNSLVRHAAGITWFQVRTQHITNAAAQDLLGVPDILVLLHRRVASWAGHIARTSADRLPRAALFGQLRGRTMPAGNCAGGKFYMHELLRVLRCAPNEHQLEATWAAVAQDRDKWKAVVSTLRSYPVPPVPQADGAPPPVADLRCKRSPCDFVAQSSQGLSRHVRLQHGTIPGNWPCQHPGCDREFRSEQGLSIHRRSHARAAAAAAAAAPAPTGGHADDLEGAAPAAAAKDHLCPECPARFALLPQLTAHRKNSCIAKPGTTATKGLDGVWRFRCPNCDTVLLSARAKSIHMTLSHPGHA